MSAFVFMVCLNSCERDYDSGSWRFRGCLVPRHFPGAQRALAASPKTVLLREESFILWETLKVSAKWLQPTACLVPAQHAQREDNLSLPQGEAPSCWPEAVGDIFKSHWTRGKLNKDRQLLQSFWWGDPKCISRSVTEVFLWWMHSFYLARAPVALMMFIPSRCIPDSTHSCLLSSSLRSLLCYWTVVLLSYWAGRFVFSDGMFCLSIFE